jgi:hypothetical protein
MMKRKLTIAGMIAIILLAAGIYLKTRERVAPAPKKVPESELDFTLDPFVLEHPVKVAFLDDDLFFPCYYDSTGKTLYRWNGVNLGSYQVPRVYSAAPSGVVILRAKDFNVVTVEAPIKYFHTAKGYSPGYLDTTSWEFFAWKGVVLEKDELLEKSTDGEHALITQSFPRITVTDIAIPEHLKSREDRWKKRKPSLENLRR